MVRHEKLHRAALLDYPFRREAFQNERDAMENSFLSLSQNLEGHELWAASQAAFRQADQAERRWTELVQNLPPRRKPSVIFQNYWNKQNQKAGLEVR